MSDLLKESIADAKAVRDTAIANAKTFLEENFAKSMKEMFADKLKEDSEQQDEAGKEEGKIEEKLASSNIGKEHGNEASKQHPVKPAPAASKNTTPAGKQEFDATMEEGTEITSEELDEILAELESDGSAAPIVAEEKEEKEEEEEEEKEKVDEQTEINLDELLAELEEEGAAPVADPYAAQVPAAPVAPAPAPAAPVAPVQGQIPSPSEGENCAECGVDSMGSDITPEEIAEALVALNEENESLKKKLAEANEGLRYVKSVLEESNILNAKLLYTNKLFKSKNLTEDQKLKVINTFDLTKTLREIKLAYTVLAESFNGGGSVAKKKSSTNATVSTITEGLASKPVPSTKPASTIVEPQADEMTSRFQKLAGIKK